MARLVLLVTILSTLELSAAITVNQTSNTNQTSNNTNNGTNQSINYHINLKHKIQLIYYPLMPFVEGSAETRGHVSALGIIDLIFRSTGLFCITPASLVGVEYSADLKSREAFWQILKSSIKYGEGPLTRINNSDSVVWGPANVHYDLEEKPYFIQYRQVLQRTILTSEKIVVIMPHSLINIHQKIIRGIVNSGKVFFLSSLLAVAFGSLFWLLEYRKNPVFEGRIGIGTGVYWSFVTMTTVGYGDVTPVTSFGRLLSVVWMFIAVVIASVLTATISDNVVGIHGLEIEGRNIAVLNRSHEHKILQSDYSAHPILRESYQEVIDAVRSEDAYAAVIPYEIAGWMQDEIRNQSKHPRLQMVYTLPAQVKFYMFIGSAPFGKDTDEVLKCMFGTFKDQVISDVLDLHNRNVFMETLDYGDLIGSEAWSDPLYAGLFGTTTGLIVIGILATIVVLYMRRRKSNRTNEGRVTEKEIEKSIKDLNILLERYYREKGNGRFTADMQMKTMPGSNDMIY